MLDQSGEERMTDIASRVEIDAAKMRYRELNAQLRRAAAGGGMFFKLNNVCGQRYLGTKLPHPVEICIHGTPGNDLAAFMDGPRIIVHGNAQDGCGNTMNSGEVIVHGRAGDAIGHSMRGGKIFIRDDVGYRAAIHMKEYLGQCPIIVIGGTTQHFLGEYMAGGILVVLGLTLHPGERHIANFIGTGMHGGVIFVRGELADYQLGREVGRVQIGASDHQLLRGLVEEFCRHFGGEAQAILARPFTKLIPLSARPYGRLYAY